MQVYSSQTDSCNEENKAFLMSSRSLISAAMKHKDTHSNREQGLYAYGKTSRKMTHQETFTVRDFDN